MAQVKMPWWLPSKPRVGKQSPSRTKAHSANSWLYCAMPSASLAETRDRCIWPSLWVRRLLRCLGRPIRRATARIAWAIDLAWPSETTSFCAAPMHSLPTNGANRLIPPCWKLRSRRFSTQFVARSRHAHERVRQLLRSLACSSRLPSRDCRAVVCAAHVEQYFARGSGGIGRSRAACVRSELSSQTGDTHRDRSLRLHPQSAVSRKRHPGSGHRNCHALLDLGFDSSGLLCGLLFRRHAPRREGTPYASRCIVRRIRPRRSAFHSTCDGRKDLWRVCRLVLFCAVQKKP